MKYCKKCIQTDTRPGTYFNEMGVCPACTYHESLKDVDWDERKLELEEIVKFGKANNYSGYDCIIGVSGGKDSTRQALYVKEVLKMNPLLVCLSYPPEQITQRGVDNVSNMIKHGFDCVVINPAPKTWQKLMRKGFLEHTNWAKTTELALFSSVPRMAIAYQIPLIWWGENVALQLGDMNALGKSGSDGNNLRKINTLQGGDLTWLLNEEIKKNNILQYCYPSEREMDEANLKITFLGYFWKDWSLLTNGIFAAVRGLEIREDIPLNTGDMQLTSLDEHWFGLNQMIKYYKYGFGKISDYVNEDIRNGRLTRNQAIELVEKFDGKCHPSYVDTLCEYLELTESVFWEQVEKSVNLNLFKKIGERKWQPKFKVGEGLINE